MLVHSHCCNQNWILSNFKLRQINSIFSRHRFVWFLFFLLLWCLFVCVYLIGRYSVFAYFVSDFVRRFPLDTVGNGNNNNRKIILKNNFITLSRTRHTKFVTFIIFFVCSCRCCFEEGVLSHVFLNFIEFLVFVRQWFFKQLYLVVFFSVIAVWLDALKNSIFSKPKKNVLFFKFHSINSLVFYDLVEFYRKKYSSHKF